MGGAGVTDVTFVICKICVGQSPIRTGMLTVTADVMTRVTSNLDQISCILAVTALTCMSRLKFAPSRREEPRFGFFGRK